MFGENELTSIIPKKDFKNRFSDSQDDQISKVIRETMGNYKAANFLSLLWNFFDSGILDVNEFSDDGVIREITNELNTAVITKIVEKYQLVLKRDYSNLVLLYENGFLVGFSITYFVGEKEILVKDKKIIEVYCSKNIFQSTRILHDFGYLTEKDLLDDKMINAWATDIKGTRFKKDSFSVVPKINFADLSMPLPEPVPRKITYRGGVVFGAPGTGKTVYLMQIAKIIFDFYEENWETKNYEDFKIVNPVYSYSFDELLKNMDDRIIQLLFCDDALLLQSKSVCNNAAVQLSRIRHVYEEKSSKPQAIIQVLFVAQELFELTKSPALFFPSCRPLLSSCSFTNFCRIKISQKG